MNVDSLAAELARGLLPLYALAGPEPYFRERAWSAIRERALAEDAEAECRTLDLPARKGEEPTFRFGDVLIELSTPSMFARRTLIRIRRAESIVADHRERLEKYLDSPPPGGTLVLDLANLDGRTRLAKKLAAANAFVESPKIYGAPPPWSNDPPHENELARWVKTEFARRKKSIRLEEAHLLCQRSGEDLFALENEIEKLASYVGSAREIAPAAILELVGTNRKAKVYELTDAVFQGNEARSLEIASTLFEEGAVDAAGKLAKGEDTIALWTLAALATELRRVYSAGEWLAATGGAGKEGELAAALGVRPFAAARYAATARRLGRDRAAAFLSVLDDTDRTLKSSGVPPESTLSLAVWRLARVAATQPAAVGKPR